MEKEIYVVRHKVSRSNYVNESESSMTESEAREKVKNEIKALIDEIFDGENRPPFDITILRNEYETEGVSNVYDRFAMEEFD